MHAYAYTEDSVAELLSDACIKHSSKLLHVQKVWVSSEGNHSPMWQGE